MITVMVVMVVMVVTITLFSLTGISEPFLCKPLSKQIYMLHVSMEEYVASEYECTVEDCHQVSSWEAKSIGKAIFPAPKARVHGGKFKSPIQTQSKSFNVE